MSVAPEGHTTHVALEHCESRPSPFPPVFDLWLPNRTTVGIGGTQQDELVELFAQAACGEAL